MKIVYFIDHLRPDGAQFKLAQLVQGLARKGHTQIIMCLNDSWDPATVEKLRRTGAEVIIIGKPALFSGFGFFRIYWLLRKANCDVTVTMLFASDLIGRPLARLAGSPRIITAIETRDEFYSALQRWLVRQSARFSDQAVICSEFIRDFVVEHEGIKSKDIRVIYNSIRTDYYPAVRARSGLEQEFNIHPGTMLIGTVGRLTHQKGLDILLAGLSQICGIDFVHVLAGTGEEETALKTQAAQLGIQDRVIFAGYRRDVPQILAALDLYVHPSRFEGMPIAILEAMASGCPIVATSVDGNQELIIDGETGWLVPPEDPKALGNAILEALQNQKEAARRGEKARQRVVSHFDESMITAQWEEVMLGLLPSV